MSRLHTQVLRHLFISQTTQNAENFGARRKRASACPLELRQSVHEFHLVRSVIPLTRCRIHTLTLRILRRRFCCRFPTLEFFDRCQFMLPEREQGFRQHIFSWSAPLSFRRSGNVQCGQIFLRYFGHYCTSSRGEREHHLFCSPKSALFILYFNDYEK